MSARKKSPRSGKTTERVLRPTPDSMRVAFQIGSFVRDAECAIVRGGSENNAARLLQALARLQDAERWLDELARLLPRRSKRSVLLASRGVS